MTRSNQFLTWLLAVILLFLSGCDAAELSTETEELIPVIAELPVEAEPQPYPVTVNDVRIKASPKRVVSLSPSLTEILYEMGYGETLVGRGSYCDHPSEISALPDIGRPAKPDYDAILSLSPELLFTATAIPVKDQYRLEEGGVRVVYLPYPRSVEEFEKIYRAVGLIYEGLFEGEEKGSECFSALRALFEGSDRFSLGSFLYITEGLSVATGDTFESSVLSRFGTNVAAEGENYDFPKETLSELQPDMILLNSSYTVDDLLSDEVYASLEAVQNGRVYPIDNTYFERPSARLGELIRRLGEALGEAEEAERAGESSAE
ncbi:MAG: ABC transporter substrate-binding protein [Bacteroides sp.]|nr:ABC transporter substrate-binding protein [Eubacterium sp.]MCM1417221.1 ABC transporter substrate-binding protein [Roseburia sp.]MCM1461158.1 ABC transporter substrate-binding protein [Bacteroides sp.]